MMPTMSFVVRSAEAPRSIVTVLDGGSTSWCRGRDPADGDTTRLVSRATLLMTALAEPGTFIMEQKMLRTIRDPVEARRT